MQTAGFDKDLNLPSSGGKYRKLKSKGEKIKFRIAATPQYETKHFIGDNNIVTCGKFNTDDKKATCKYCDQYEAMVSAGDKDGAKQIAPVSSFYYPILNLDTNEAEIFQFNAKSIHYTIKGYSDEGVNVFECDWSIERTEEKGNYYKVLRLSDKPLTKEQKEVYEKAKLLKLSGKESSSVSLEEEADDSLVQ